MKRKILSILALLLVAVTGSTHLYAASINWLIQNVYQPSNPGVKANGYIAYLFVTENNTDVTISTTTLSDVTTLLNQGKIIDAIALSSANGSLTEGTISAPTNISNEFENGDRLTAFAIVFDASKATEAEHYFLVNGGVTQSVSFTSGTGTKFFNFGKQAPSAIAENWHSIPVNITLKEDADNSETLTSNKDKMANVTLTRTLQAGGWNTFAVPFSINSDVLAAKGMTVKQLASSSLSGDLLTLNFEDATSIEAGTPYLVKVNAEVVNPTFEGVTVSSASNTVSTEYADFVPAVNKTDIEASENVLFIADGNTLTYPTADGILNGFRAYFQLKSAASARTFQMMFDGETTGIKTIGNASVTTGSSAVYDLQGRRVENPTHGLYIVNGKKVVVK